MEPSAGFPLSLTSFVGRERELADLRALLGGATRLVTLTGSSGSGKTRLAQELAATVAGVYEAGVHWVELGPLQDPALVTDQVAEALGVQNRRGMTGTSAIAGGVGDGRALIVLDNCEHVVKSVAELVVGLLGRCPQLKVLATSREALAIPGEMAWLVPSLSLPDAASPPSPESLARSEAAQLFVQRAAEVLPRFSITMANASDIAAICRRLDGIPLALELAAARMRSLGPAQLLARLDDRFGVLTARSRTAPPRHRTLRAAIDWSYDLLSGEERALMDRLSIFAGTFDLEAVEHICSGGAVAEENVLDLVSGLVEKSLVEVLERGSVVRYRLLESVREYAADRLEGEGLQAEIGRRHAEYFEGVVRAAEPHLTLPGRRTWIDRLAEDNDNLRQALAWTRDSHPAAHLTLVGRLCWYWFGTEHWWEGRRWLEAALTLPEAAAPAVGRSAALFALGVLATLQGQAEVGRPVLEESLAIANELQDRRQAAYARVYLGLSLAAEARPEAIPILNAARVVFQEDGDLYGGRLALLCLGAFAAAVGSFDEAAELTEAGLEAARAFGQDRELAVSLRQLAMVELRRGAASRAAALAGEALECLVRDPQHYFIAMSLEALGGALADLGRHPEAIRLFGAGERIRQGIGVAVAGIDRPVYEPRIAAGRGALGEAAFDEAWKAGSGLSAGEALAYGRTLVEALRDPALAEGGTPTGATEVKREPGIHEVAALMAIHAADEVSGGLTVAALGSLEIHLDGQRIDPASWSHLRPRELLVYLLCHPAGRTRQEVGHALWPESAPAQVKNSFHVALHHLRKTLGRPEWVRLEDDRYRIASEFGVTFDVADFERGVKDALRNVREGSVRDPDGLRATLSLYRGDFLAEEAMGAWCLEHRDHFRRLYVDGMVALGALLLETGANEDALEVSRRVVLIDDLHEGAYRQLMTAYARTGERMLSIRQFERLAALLQEELSAEPETETVALHRRILAAEPV